MKSATVRDVAVELDDDAERVLFKPELARRWSVSRPTIWEWIRDNKLPRPDVRVAGRDGWYLGTIREYEQRDVGAVRAPQVRQQAPLKARAAAVKNRPRVPPRQPKHMPKRAPVVTPPAPPPKEPPAPPATTRIRPGRPRKHADDATLAG